MVVPLCAAFFLSLSPDATAQPGTGRVTGTIVEARTSAPLAAVLIKVQSTGQQVFSDAEGRFEIPDIAAGSQTLLISVVGYGLVRRDVTVVAGEAVDVSIPVADGASTYVEDVAVSASPFREAEPGVPSQSVLGSRELLGLRDSSPMIRIAPRRCCRALPQTMTSAPSLRSAASARHKRASPSTVLTARCCFIPYAASKTRDRSV
jgi:CarboxypepD_reg-like domain